MSDRARELLERLLSNWEHPCSGHFGDLFDEVRELLSTPEQTQDEEPVAWVIPGGVTENKDLAEANGNSAKPLYLHPEPKVPFVRLTDEELENLGGKYVGPMSDGEFHLMVITQNALEEKNR